MIASGQLVVNIIWIESTFYSVSALGIELTPVSSVGLSVWKVYCGKTADWIRMPFGIGSGVSRGMGVLDGGPRGARRRGGVKGFSFRLV